MEPTPGPDASDTLRDCGSRNVSGGAEVSEPDQNYIDKINQLTNQPSAPPAKPPAMPSEIPTDPTEAAKAMANGSQAMLAQAQSGELAIDPQAGRDLINTLNTQIDTLTSLDPHVNRISQETKLGMTPGGLAMAKFNQEVAATGNKAFAPAHRQFIATLQTMVQAVQAAMDNYASTETDNAQNLKAKD